MNQTKNKGGRPRAEINIEQVKTLAGLNCTEQEIAAVLGITHRTWIRHKKQDPELEEMVEQGKLTGNASLRRTQWQTAMDGNVTMQIWLGKNRLGQSDKQQIEQHQIERLVITRADDEGTETQTTGEAMGSSQGSGEISGPGSGSPIRQDVPRSH
jgi:hypothetical protein